MNGITLDGITYDVRAVYGTLKRSFDFAEGPNYGSSKYGTEILDTIGTKYSYSVDIEPNPSNPAAYDSFYEAISSPDRTHSVVMPYGQTTLAFDAIVNGGQDNYQGKKGDHMQWDGLTVEFKPKYPQSLR